MRPTLLPNPDSIKFRHRMFFDIGYVPDMQYRAITQLVYRFAIRRVWTMEAPMDAGLPNDDAYLRHCAMVGKRVWSRIKDDVLTHFQLIDNEWYPPDHWVEITMGDSRPAIPASLRMRVMKRDDFTCGYCGTREGPFDLDHVIPFSRGGSHISEENLICACAKCNRSKSDMTPEEWVRKIGGGA